MRVTSMKRQTPFGTLNHLAVLITALKREGARWKGNRAVRRTSAPAPRHKNPDLTLPGLALP
jgi:hypothetical protein